MTDICAYCGQSVELEEAHAHGLDYYHPECCSQCRHPSRLTAPVTDRAVIAVACAIFLILAAIMMPTIIRGPEPVAQHLEQTP